VVDTYSLFSTQKGPPVLLEEPEVVVESSLPPDEDDDELPPPLDEELVAASVVELPVEVWGSEPGQPARSPRKSSPERSRSRSCRFMARWRLLYRSVTETRGFRDDFPSWVQRSA